MKVNRYCITAALAVAAALAVPSLASAHTSVYTDFARIDTDSGPGYMLATQGRHVVTNHGFTFVLRETNGVSTKGVVDYSRLPGDYRAAIPQTQRLAEADTGAQAHATCRAVAALEDEAAIVAWQAPDDPFYNYIPFQAGSAGLEDHPEAWIDDVQTLVNVDLTTADPKIACESPPPTGLGGTYVPADEVQTTTEQLNSGYAHLLTAPLVAEIDLLTAEVDQLGSNLAAAQAAAAAGSNSSAIQQQNVALKVEIAKLKLEATTLKINPATTSARAAANGVSIKVSGPAGKPVTIRMAVGKGAAKALKLKSRQLGKVTGTIRANAAANLKLTPGASAKAALSKAKRSVKVSFQAKCLDRSATAARNLSR